MMLSPTSSARSEDHALNVFTRHTRLSRTALEAIRQRLDVLDNANNE